MTLREWCAEEARVKIHLTGGQAVEGKLLSREEGILYLKTFVGAENAIPLTAVQRVERLADPACGARDD